MFSLYHTCLLTRQVKPLLFFQWKSNKQFWLCLKIIWFKVLEDLILYLKGIYWVLYSTQFLIDENTNHTSFSTLKYYQLSTPHLSHYYMWTVTLYNAWFANKPQYETCYHRDIMMCWLAWRAQSLCWPSFPCHLQ